jgi:presenilin-like A22 family membrane protease
MKKKEKFIKKDPEPKPSFVGGLGYWFFIFLIVIFLLTQIIGLVTANYYSSNSLVRGVITDDPNNIWNAIFIIAQIIVFTVILLLLKKVFKSGNFIYVFEFLALFVGMVVVFDIFVSYLSAMLASFIILAIREIIKGKLKSKKVEKVLLWYNNFVLVIAIAGAGSIIGLSLGIIPIIFLLVLLSIYDIVAVFWTKHMITLAKMFIKKKVALTFGIPSKIRLFQLGGGDIVIPLAVSSSLFYVLIKKFSFASVLFPIVLVWVASLAGLIWTFHILSTGRKRALPALPIQCGLMLLVIILTAIVYGF